MINNPSAYEATAWIDRGACTDPFAPTMFPSDGDSYGIEAAKGTCAICAVRSECLEGALARGEQWGVWGGMTAEERKTFRRRQQRNGRSVKDLGLPDND